VVQFDGAGGGRGRCYECQVTLAKVTSARRSFGRDIAAPQPECISLARGEQTDGSKQQVNRKPRCG